GVTERGARQCGEAEILDQQRIAAHPRSASGEQRGQHRVLAGTRGDLADLRDVVDLADDRVAGVEGAGLPTRARSDAVQVVDGDMVAAVVMAVLLRDELRDREWSESGGVARVHGAVVLLNEGVGDDRVVVHARRWGCGVDLHLAGPEVASSGPRLRD